MRARPFLKNPTTTTTISFERHPYYDPYNVPGAPRLRQIGSESGGLEPAYAVNYVRILRGYSAEDSKLQKELMAALRDNERHR